MNISSLIVRLTFSDNLMHTFMSMNTFLDVLISVPFVILTRITNGRLVYIPYFLRAFVLIPQLRNFLRLRSYWPLFNFSVLREKIILLFANMALIIYVGMTTFHFCETRFGNLGQAKGNVSQDSNLSILQTFYFVVITISTVGYGDITPTTIVSQLLVVCMILVSLVLIPGLVSDVQENFKLQQQGAGTYVRGRNAFVIVCGNFKTITRLHDIFQSITCRSATKKTRLVILSRERASARIKSYINQSLYKDQITFLQGTGLTVDDLERVQLKYASAAFVLADWSSVSPVIEDEHNTLRAWAFDDHATHVPLYVDNILPTAEILQSRTTTASICIADLKGVFLGYNCLYRGVGTLMINLVQQPLEYADYEDIWRAQYADGARNEIFHLPLNPAFLGLRFTDLSYYLFKEFQVILFGLAISTHDSSDAHVMLNPGRQYVLKEDDICLLISNNEQDINDIRDATRAEVERLFSDSVYDTFEDSRNTFTVRRPIRTSTMYRLSSGVHKSDDFVQAYPVRFSHEDKVPLCWLVKKRCTTQEILITSASHIHFHVILCSLHYEHFRFLCTLRSAYLPREQLKPVVILCPRKPTDEEFQALSVFPEVYVMVGSPGLKYDLDRANIESCDKIVIKGMQSPEGITEDSEDYFNDSSPIMIAHLIHSMFKGQDRKYVVVELDKRSNIRFLRPTAKKRGFTSKKLLNIQSQVRQHLTRGSEFGWTDNCYFTPNFSSGRVLTSSMLEPILFHAYHNPYILDIFYAFCGVQYQRHRAFQLSLGIERSELCYVAVPVEFVGKQFGELYEYFARKVGIIPIGLFRDEVDEERLGNKLPYVVTNPLFCLKLRDTDLVYVVGPQSKIQ